MNLEQIDTSTTAGKAEVMRLAAEGWNVSSRIKGSKVWWACATPKWLWEAFDYRAYPRADRAAIAGEVK